MAFPIRFKLIDKTTGQELKGKDEYGSAICALLYPSGQIGQARFGYMDTAVKDLSCADYELHVALDKGHDGKWIYKKVGY